MVVSEMIRKLRGLRLWLAVGVPQSGLVTAVWQGRPPAAADCGGSVLTHVTVAGFASSLCYLKLGIWTGKGKNATGPSS